MRALVTGGAGFIGSHVAQELLRAGHTVTVVDDLSGGFIENVPTGAEFVQGDVSDPAFVRSLFAAHSFESVFHLAAYAAEGLSHFIRRFNYTNNLIASVNLINAAADSGVSVFVFTSSIAVYGNSQVLPITEDTPPLPEDPYGIAKLAVEYDLKCAHAMFGLPYIIFRPHNVYGERQNIGDNYRNVVGIFMNQLLQGTPMSVFGDGEQRRAFSYIGDVAPLIARSIEVPAALNQEFNVGADAHASVNELAAAVADAMGVAPNIVHLPARQEVKVTYASHQKLKSVFGVHRETSLREGLRAMAAWAKAHGARQGKRFDDLEVAKNFPEAWRSLIEPSIRT